MHPLRNVTSIKRHGKWPLGRSFRKNGVGRTSRWPLSQDILFYNDRKRGLVQSDGEPKRYKQVC